MDKVYIVMYVPDGAPSYDTTLEKAASTEEKAMAWVYDAIKTNFDEDATDLDWPNIGNKFGYWIEDMELD